MKALTICQPYASLIARGVKRVENRTWPTRYRGPLVIHAGKSRQWLTDDGPSLDPRENYGIALSEMPFGAVIAVAQLIDCVSLSGCSDYMERTRAKYPWLAEHEHASGPWCWILDYVQPFSEPVPYKGSQGLWDYPVAKVFS